MATDKEQFGTGLRIELKVTNLDLSPTIEAYLEKKLVSLERHLDPTDTSVYGQVELGRTTKHHRSGPVFRAEMNLFVQGVQHRAEATSEDLHAAIDEMKDEIERRLTQGKDKKKTNIRQGGKRAKEILHTEEGL
jgi:ribosomal subunit interface protein